VVAESAVRAHPAAVAEDVGASRRSILTMADQAVSSASNFAVGVAVAHIAGILGLGVFAVGYAAWLFVASLHRSLVTDPMAIEQDARSSSAHQRLGTGLAAELVFGLIAAAVCVALGLGLRALGAGSAGSGLVAVAVWLPFLAVQDYWRWVGFMAGRPGRSLINDILFALVQAAAFAALVLSAATRTTFLVLGCWGLGAVAGAVYGCWQYRVAPRLRGGAGLLTSRWHMSRWLVGNDLTLWGSSQGYLLLAGLLLGPTELGGLKAAQTLITGPAFVILQVGGSIGLPEAAKAFASDGPRGLRRVVRRLSGLGSLAIGAIAVVMAVLTAVYGPAFRDLQEAATLLAVAYTVAALGLGPTMALKATRRTRRLFRDQLAGLIVTLVAGVLLAGRYRIDGIAGAAVLGSSVQALLLWTSVRRPVGPPARHRAVARGRAAAGGYQ
jgi:O-antigen/teichoic acid export membrane protein